LAAMSVWPEVADIAQWQKGRDIELEFLEKTLLHERLAGMLDRGDVEGAAMLAAWNLGQ
jgi:hypothetical protein